MIRMRFKLIVFAICLMTIGANGQKQSKTYSEVFNVNPETVLDIDTRNADIEFETWDKDQIAVEAVVEIEGATVEEAADYFEDRSVEIVGNSEKIKISTGSNYSWSFSHSMDALKDLHIEIPDFHFEMPELPELPEAPEVPPVVADLSHMPMPPVPPVVAFDYEAYKKDGEKYMKKWQRKFEKGFDKDYEKKMEEWSAKMEERQEIMQKRHEEMQQRHLEMAEKQREAQEKRMEKRAEAMEKRALEMEKRLEEREKVRALREKEREARRQDANIFYFSHDGKHKKYEVKKTIKIKMPKGTKIKMNVRHGEVKLAENTKNINARLSYASLVANTIDGDLTIIKTSYSPVSVQKWNYGLLQADYSDHIDLREVLNLRLSTVSSNTTIDKILKNLVADNKMGPLTINEVSKDFKEVDISLQNAELVFHLPETAFEIEVDGQSSKLEAPTSLTLDQAKNYGTTVHKGYKMNKNSDKSILINAAYSDVVLKD